MPSYSTPLSLLDQRMPHFHTIMWLCFASKDPDAAVLSLQEGLNKTAQQLPFLTGQVYEDVGQHMKTVLKWSDDDPHLLFEEVSGEGLPSYEALRKQSMALDLLSHEFKPPSLIACMGKDPKPAFIASYTKVKGGLIVLLAPHHHLMDGGGRQTVFNILARHTRGVDGYCKVDSSEPALRDKVISQFLASELNRPRSSTLSTRRFEKTQGPSSTHFTSNAKRRMFTFSIEKLSNLRETLAKEISQPFTLNTLLSVLIWTTVTEVRIRRLKATNAGIDFDSLETTFVMAKNMRKVLEPQLLLEKDTFVGNLAVGVIPPPKLSLKSLKDYSRMQIATNAGQLEVNSNLLDAIDKVTCALASMSTAQVALMFAGAQDASKHPDFDFRGVRDVGSMFNGLNLIVTSWMNFDFYLDFGSNLGIPQYMRMMGQGFDGICVVLPRKRGSGWTEDELDTIELFLALKEEDMQVFSEDEFLKGLMKKPPL